MNRSQRPRCFLDPLKYELRVSILVRKGKLKLIMLKTKEREGFYIWMKELMHKLPKPISNLDSLFLDLVSFPAPFLESYCLI